MNATTRYLFSLALLSGVCLSDPVLAGSRVELELAVEEGVPITGRQEWLQRLAGAGIEGFRIRSSRPGDQPKIDRRGTAEAPSFAVTGIITANDEVVVPGARFRASQMGELAAWLRDLSELGPPDERPTKVAFGLVAEDFERLQADLAPPLGFNTQGLSRAEVIRQAAKVLSTPLSADSRLAEPLSKDIVAEDLSALSRGTALAYVLRSPGLCLVPGGKSGSPSLSIVEAKPDMEIWPIGWAPEKPERDIKPELFELRDVNVSGVPVTTVLEAVGKRLEMPVLLDHNATARHGLEPAKVIANLQPSRSSYSIMLRKVLFQARLKGELRLDDGDRPFLWVTSLKPL
ncbi:MAG: hypothetical protein GXX96_17245 [Planctomycetaceae bacterium]|nr:hypothetical protein [Planctomycetaceae bacterium]